MKAELRSESRAEMGGAEKSGKAHFSACLFFLPSFRWAGNRGAQSKSVKVNQTSPVRARLPAINMQMPCNE